MTTTVYPKTQTSKTQDLQPAQGSSQPQSQVQRRVVYALYWAEDKVYAVDRTATGVLLLCYSTKIAAEMHVRDNEAFLSSHYGYAPGPVEKDLADHEWMPRWISLDGVCIDRWERVGAPAPGTGG